MLRHRIFNEKPEKFGFKKIVRFGFGTRTEPNRLSGTRNSTTSQSHLERENEIAMMIFA